LEKNYPEKCSVTQR